MHSAIPMIAATAAILIGGAAAIELMPTNYENGVSAYGRGDYSKAARQFQEAAANGQAESQFMLGRLYAMGLGVPQDLVQAYVWHSKAAAQGHAGATAALASLKGILTPEALNRAQAATSVQTDGVPRAVGSIAPSALPRPTAVADVGNSAPKPADILDITRVQIKLAEIGLFSGTADGIYNAELASAISAYQRASGLKQDGTITPELLASLNIENAKSGRLVRQAAATQPAPLRSSADRDAIQSVQRHLAALGYDPGPADGIAGPRTRAAVEAWQKANGQQADGRIDAETISAILLVPPKKRGGTEIAAAPAPDKPDAPPSGKPAAPKSLLQAAGPQKSEAKEAPKKVAAAPQPAKEAPKEAANRSAIATALDRAIADLTAPKAVAAPPPAAQPPAPPAPTMNAAATPPTTAPAAPAAGVPAMPSLAAIQLPEPATLGARGGLTELQRELAYHGYLSGRPSGALDEPTRNAIRKYQRDAGLAVTGEPSSGLLDHIRYNWPQIVQDQGSQTR